MPVETALATDILRTCQLTGNFTLRSGRDSTDYFDKYQFEASPDILNRVVKAMLPLIPAGTEVLAGLEMGGIPLVTMLSHHSGLPAVFVRKIAKQYGTARFAECASVTGKRVLVIEDVVTSGGQLAISTTQLREIGATIHSALCAIDRQEGGAEALAKHDLRLISLFTRSGLQSAN